MLLLVINLWFSQFHGVNELSFLFAWSFLHNQALQQEVRPPCPSSVGRGSECSHPHPASQQDSLDQCMPVCLWWDRQIIASGEKAAHKKYSPVLHKPMVSLLKQSDLQVMCAVWKINLSISLTVFTLNKNKIDGWKNIKICAACLIYFQSFQKYM